MKPYLSVVVPAYNEATNFEAGKLDELYEYLQDQSYAYELILVDDGSSDDTPKLLHRFSEGKKGVIVIERPHGGKAPTVSAGMLAATGENRLFTDFDQSTPISEVEKLLPFRTKAYDVVIGSREVQGAKREREPWYRHLMGRGFNLFVKLFTIQGIQDTQCGFKLFSEQATTTLFPRLRVYGGSTLRSDAFTGAFDVELLYLAHKMGMKVAEVPVFWKHVKTARVSPVKDSLRMFIDILKIRLKDMMGGYAA